MVAEILNIHLTGRFLILLLVLMLSAGLASATPITYDVNRTIGIGSVTGFIETDGTTGVLGTANFIDWNLLLNNGTTTFDLTGPLSGNNSVVYTQGSDATATATQLLFNFSGSDNGILLFQQGLFSGFHYYCAATQNGTCFQGETASPAFYTTGQVAGRSGTIVIGTTVPEPESLILLASGIAGAASLLRRRRPL